MFPKEFNLGSIFKSLEYALYFNICSRFTHFFQSGDFVARCSI